jgi:hypothetical protein
LEIRAPRPITIRVTVGVIGLIGSLKLTSRS